MSDDERMEFRKELRKLCDSSLALQRASEALQVVRQSLAGKRRSREKGKQA